MKKLHFTSLKIRKAPGFRDGLNVNGFNAFSPGINIIAGPNGAGKSTTARTLLDLIWPERKNRRDLEASAKFDYDNNHWTEHLSIGELKIQKDGTDTILPERPSEDSRKVYMLALHELVNDADSDLAERIVVESMGGVNLDKAGESLCYSGDLKRGASKEYNKAFEAYRKVESDQLSLESREKTLAELKAGKEDASKAISEKEFYILADEHICAMEDFDTSKEKLGEFTGILENLRGNEVEAIDNLSGLIDGENREIIMKEEVIRDREAEISKLNLPDDGTTLETINLISDYAGKIKEYETRIDHLDCDLFNLRSIEADERKKIGEADQEKLKNIDISHLGELEEYFRKVLTLKEKEIRLNSEITDIENETGTRQSRTSELYGQLNDLRSKNSTPDQKGGGIWLIVLVAFLGIATSIATFFLGKTGLSGILLIVAATVTGYILIRRGTSKIEDEALANQLDELEKLVNSEILRDEKINRKNYLSGELKKIKNTSDDLRTSRLKVNEELIAIPELPENLSETDSLLFQFLSHLQKWQKVQSDITGKESEKKGIEEFLKDLITKCNTRLRTHQLDAVSESADIFAVCKTLALKETTRRDAVNDIKNARGQITASVNRMHEHALAIKTIYRKLEVPYGERESAGMLIDSYPDFDAARQRASDCSRILRERGERIKSHSLYKTFEDELQGWGHEKIQKKIAACDEMSGKLESLTREIAEIEAEIKQKKKGNELETALSEKNNKHAELTAMLDKNLSSLTGNLLLKHLKAENDSKNRPEVLKRADSLFNSITFGRYNLIADGDQEPRFRAVDSGTGEGFDLDHLSTATRVQLLLSVRIAFIELLERNSIRLPVIADELLANSDEVRGEAIINALYEISKQGRQIFYLTAQEDEVMRWKSFLESREEKPNHKIINLGSTEREYDKTVISGNIKAEIKFTYQPPEPEDLTIEEYRTKINVRPFDLLTDKAEQLSLAYLINDTTIVYDCLKRGIDSWGMLSGYCNCSGRIGSISDSMLEKMRNKAMLLSEYQELYRPGRPKRIDMNILYQSGKIREKFIGEIKDKLEFVKCNPVDLLIEMNSIPRYRKEYITELEVYLKEKGFIDDSVPISEEQIRIRLQARIEQLGLDPVDAEKFLNSITGN